MHFGKVDGPNASPVPAEHAAAQVRPDPTAPGEAIPRPGTDASSGAHRLRSIQYLRATAALLVLVYHLGFQLPRLGYTGPWPDWTQHGVDIFFIISGVVMWLTTSGRPGDVVAFYRRRILRILPLYYLITTFVVAVLLVLPKVVQTGRFDAAHVLGSYLFLPVRHPVISKAVPVLVPGWTLNCEMLFYAVFGLTILLPERLRIPVCILALVSIVLAGIHDPTGSAAASLYGSSIMLEFGLGLVLGAMVGRVRFLSASGAWSAIVLGAVALAGLSAPEMPRVLAAGLPALVIAAGVIALERRDRLPPLPGLLLLGDASYALYLLHEIILSACSQIVLKAGFGDRAWSAAAYAPLALCACVVSSVALHRFVEQPMQRGLLSMLATGRRTRPAVGREPR